MKIASNKVRDIIRFFRDELKEVYRGDELETIIAWCFEFYLGYSRTQLLLNTENTVSESELLKFSFAVKELKKHRPLQHILGEADFLGMKFFVNEHVLIPRPETEELVERIISENANRKGLRILDIGTGSGCIAVTLAKKIPGSVVSAIDVSENALEVAKRNALRNVADVNFIQHDILSGTFSPGNTYDIIVSNPPYVLRSEMNLIEKNVTDHEPHLALFVENNDPLLFYRVIADLSLKHLEKGGSLYFEINRALGPETQHLLESKGFKNVVLHRDLSNNNRILRGTI